MHYITNKGSEELRRTGVGGVNELILLSVCQLQANSPVGEFFYGIENGK